MEVKTTDGSLKPIQKSTLKKILKSGAEVYVVRSSKEAKIIVEGGNLYEFREATLREIHNS